MKSAAVALGLVSASFLLVSCGGDSAPAQPAPVVVATPTPAPTPTPKPLSVIPSCSLAASRPPSPSCTAPSSRLGDAVNAALDRVIRERPDLFNINDVNGGPKVLDYNGYMTAVVAAIGDAGLCGKIDPEGEIGVKNSNSFNEQWIVVTSANYVRRKYVGACSPATF